MKNGVFFTLQKSEPFFLKFTQGPPTLVKVDGFILFLWQDRLWSNKKVWLRDIWCLLNISGIYNSDWNATSRHLSGTAITWSKLTHLYIFNYKSNTISVQTGCLIFKVFLKFNFVPPLLGVWDQNLTLCINLEAIHFKSTGCPSLLSPASGQNP